MAFVTKKALKNEQNKKPQKAKSSYIVYLKYNVKLIKQKTS